MIVRHSAYTYVVVPRVDDGAIVDFLCHEERGPWVGHLEKGQHKAWSEHGEYQFTFVRHPVLRLLNAYVQMKNSKLRPRKDVPLSHNERAVRYARRCDDFTEFCLTAGEYVRPMAYWLTDKEGNLTVDHFYRYEEWDNGWANVCNILETPCLRPAQKLHLASLPVEMISPQAVEIIVRDYEQDFDLFDYPKEMP